MIKKTIDDDIFKGMENCISPEEVAELAIPSYRHRNPFMRWMAWKRVNTVIDLMQKYVAKSSTNGKLDRVMDYGCGTGVLFQPLGECFDQIFGVDLVLSPAKYYVNQCNISNVSLLTPDQVAEEIEEASLDLIVCAEVLEHIDEPDEVLNLFKTRLKPGGLLLVSLPTENALYKLGRRLASFSGEYHVHNAKTIHPVILESGFKQESLHKIPLGGGFSIYWIIEYHHS